MATRVGERIPDADLTTVGGDRVRLHDLVDRPTIVHCLRYYG